MTDEKPINNSVIWIASYPKSGNTWVQSVIREAGKSYGFPGRDYDVYKMLAEQRTPDWVSGIQPDIGGGETTVLKTHSRYASNVGVHPQLKLRTIGFVYVMRNPLDMLLSYINFTRIQYEKLKTSQEYQNALFRELLGFERAIPYEEWLSMSLETIPRANLNHALVRFIELETTIPSNKYAGGSWLAHCFSWLEAGKAKPAVFLKYEDLLHGPEHFLPLQKLFTFTTTQIVDAVAVVNKRAGGLKDTNIFYNKMSAYYYPQFFSADLISKFLDRYQDELRLLGYEDLPRLA